MNDPQENIGPAGDPESANRAEDLGRSYGKLLDQPAWEVDRIVEGGEDQAFPSASLGGEASETVATETTPATAPEVPPAPLRIIEALLFVGGLPLTAERTCETIRGMTEAQFQEMLDALNHDYRRQDRPYFIQSQGEGHALALRPRYQVVMEKLYGAAREARLSPAAIDVLALVAYRQPATKQEIDGIRGNDSGALLKQLVRRGLITVVHRPEAAQREAAYGTTASFLEFFGLRSLDDLPQTQDLQRI